MHPSRGCTPIKGKARLSNRSKEETFWMAGRKTMIP